MIPAMSLIYFRMLQKIAILRLTTQGSYIIGIKKDTDWNLLVAFQAKSNNNIEEKLVVDVPHKLSHPKQF